MKKTLVIGASENPERYSNKAVRALVNHGHEVVAVGIRAGNIGDIEITTEKPQYADIHTVTMYIGEQHQMEYVSYILSLKPERVIFNPGAENPTFEQTLKNAGIEATEACTLVLLSIGAY